jgi:hypothetical protein
VRLAVLLLVLLPVVVAHGEDRDVEPGGLSTRLRAIDESAEFEADHPERAGEEPAEAEEEQPVDPTVLPAEEIEAAAAPPRSRRGTQPARRSGAASAPAAPTAPPAPPARPLGSTLESPIGTGPLAPSRDADDEF